MVARGIASSSFYDEFQPNIKNKKQFHGGRLHVACLVSFACLSVSRSRFEWKVFQILERSQVSKEARHPPNLRKIAGFKRGKASPVFPLTVFQRVGQDGPEKTTNAQFLTVETQKRQRKKQRRAGTVAGFATRLAQTFGKPERQTRQGTQDAAPQRYIGNSSEVHVLLLSI